jgi:hypothetical protein
MFWFYELVRNEKGFLSRLDLHKILLLLLIFTYYFLISFYKEERRKLDNEIKSNDFNSLRNPAFFNDFKGLSGVDKLAHL